MKFENVLANQTFPHAVRRVASEGWFALVPHNPLPGKTAPHPIFGCGTLNRDLSRVGRMETVRILTLVAWGIGNEDGIHGRGRNSPPVQVG